NEVVLNDRGIWPDEKPDGQVAGFLPFYKMLLIRFGSEVFEFAESGELLGIRALRRVKLQQAILRCANLCAAEPVLDRRPGLFDHGPRRTFLRRQTKCPEVGMIDTSTGA